MTETKVKYAVNGGREAHPETLSTVSFNDQLADRLQRILEMKQELEETRKTVTRLDIDINHAEEALNKLLSEDKGTLLKVGNRLYCCVKGNVLKPIVVEIG